MADVNTFSSATKTIDTVVKIIESERNCGIDWFDENKMIVNPDKFQAVQ